MYKHGFGTCPNSLTISEKLITWPLHMNLTDEDIDYVIEQVIKVNQQIEGWVVL
jgi:dTDP-4-amino-4,6-dideoxygalactose transaminase